MESTNGISITFYTDSVTKPDYHRHTRQDLLAKRAQLILYKTWQMANREHPMKRDIPLPKE